jgi:hypothetical protein
MALAMGMNGPVAGSDVSGCILLWQKATASFVSRSAQPTDWPAPAWWMMLGRYPSQGIGRCVGSVLRTISPISQPQTRTW